MKKIAFGRTADIYELDDGRVLKLYKQGWSADAVDREFRFSKIAYDAGLPTPRCFEKVSVDGRNGLIFQKVSGPSMLTVFTRQPWRVLELSKLFANLHAKIHLVKINQERSFKEDICARLQGASGSAQRYKDTALKILNNLPDGNSLLHGDFHPDNILMTKTGPVIIDWMTGSRGSPAADAAQSAVIMRNGALPADQSALAKFFIQIGRMISVAAYLRNYTKQANVSKKELQQWNLPLLVTRLALNIPGEAESIQSLIYAEFE